MCFAYIQTFITLRNLLRNRPEVIEGAFSINRKTGLTCKMTQSKHRGRKRYRTGDEEAQLFHPASKRRDLNDNRDLLDISALSINGSNGFSHANGTDQNGHVSPQNCEPVNSHASGSQHFPNHHHQLGQLPPHHQNVQPSTSQAIPVSSALSRNQSDDSDENDDDDQPSSSYYKDINMILKKAHFDFLQRRKLPYPE